MQRRDMQVVHRMVGASTGSLLVVFFRAIKELLLLCVELKIETAVLFIPSAVIAPFFASSLIPQPFAVSTSKNSNQTTTANQTSVKFEYLTSLPHVVLQHFPSYQSSENALATSLWSDITALTNNARSLLTKSSHKTHLTPPAPVLSSLLPFPLYPFIESNGWLPRRAHALAAHAFVSLGLDSSSPSPPTSPSTFQLSDLTLAEFVLTHAKTSSLPLHIPHRLPPLLPSGPALLAVHPYLSHPENFAEVKGLPVWKSPLECIISASMGPEKCCASAIILTPPSSAATTAADCTLPLSSEVRNSIGNVNTFNWARLVSASSIGNSSLALIANTLEVLLVFMADWNVKSATFFIKDPQIIDSISNHMLYVSSLVSSAESDSKQSIDSQPFLNQVVKPAVAKYSQIEKDSLLSLWTHIKKWDAAGKGTSVKLSCLDSLPNSSGGVAIYNFLSLKADQFVNSTELDQNGPVVKLSTKWVLLKDHPVSMTMMSGNQTPSSGAAQLIKDP